MDKLLEALSSMVDSDHLADIQSMPLEEAIGYTFTLLLEQGIEDPEEWLRQHLILA